jgi:SH3-like domain-containing protein
MRARLLRDYRTQYPDPIRFGAGERVVLGARDSEWPEFLWATDAAGRSGWVHEKYLCGSTGETTARRDYDARELDADTGQTVELIEEAGGWWWSQAADGRSGWLPARDLDIERNPP